MFSVSVLLALALACDVSILPTTPYTDVSKTVYDLAPSTSNYTLCLTSSLSGGAFSLQVTTPPIYANITIQYLSHRSECLSSPCVPETLWLRGHFTWPVLGVLTFRNVRITGQRLIWEECEEEWCTHCLAPPYLWPGWVDFTVIDHHPAASPSDPYYEASLCLDGVFSFFYLLDSMMVIENCTIDNVRIRAQSFINLYGTSSLIITNTSIVRMDFTRYFIYGFSEKVSLSGLYVAEFNRGHAYVPDSVSDSVQDSGFIQLSSCNHFTLASSLFEHNLKLYPKYFQIAFVDISEFKLLIFEACVFRSSMHTFYMSNFITFHFSIQILNCLFEEDLSLNRFGYINVLSRLAGEVRIADSMFRNITTQGTTVFTFQLPADSSVLEISGTTFVNIVAYFPLNEQNPNLVFSLIATVETVILKNNAFQMSTGNQLNLVGSWVSKGLINDSPDVYTEFVERPPSPCYASLLFTHCSIINFQNVSLTDSVCDAVLMMFNSMHAVLQLNVTQMVVARVAGGVKSNFTSSEVFHGRITSSRFEAVSGTALSLNGTIGSTTELLVEDCDFTGSGIAFLGTRLEVRDSSFTGVSSMGGAVDYTALDSEAAQPEVTLCIENSTFVSNRGQQWAADVGIRSNNYVILLDVALRACNFTHFYATSGGSMYIEKLQFKKAVIEFCRFEEGEVDVETGVLSTAHMKGTLSLNDVLFTSVYTPKAYLLKVISPSIPSIDLQTLTNLTRVSVLNCTYKAAVLLKGQYWLTWLNSYLCRFAGNHGVVVMSEGSVWNDVQSVVEDNTAEDYTCYFQAQRSIAHFQGSQFLRNAANSGSCMYLLGLDSSSVFADCLFQGNQANFSAGVMRIEQSPTVEITASRFIGNSAPRASVLLLVNVHVSVRLASCVLQGNEGNGVIVLSNSALTLERSSLQDNRGQETAGVVMVRSSLLASQVSFARQTGLRGCLIHASSSSSVSLKASDVTQITCIENILDLASNSTLAISHSTFTHLVSTKQSVIRVEDGLLRADFFQISDITTEQAFLSTLHTNVSIGFSEWRGLKGGGIQAEAGELFALEASEMSDVWTETTVLQCSAQSVRLVGVRVSNVTGSRGVRLQAEQVQMQDCVFRRVRGQVEGAVWVESSELEVADSVFLHNRASDKNSVSGALRLLANFSAIRNCTFAFNVARSGAAIYYLSNPPTLSNTTFFANQALYGPALASFAGRLHLFNHSSIEVASGQAFTGIIVVGLLDNRNQLVTTQVPSDARLVGSGLSGRLSATAQGGVYRFTNFTVTNHPAQLVTLTVVHNVLEPIQLILRIRSCLLGEIYFGQACVICPPSTYSVDANHSNCQLCPSGGSCPGDGHLYPNTGYWRPFQSYNGLLECPNPDACVGHNNYLTQFGVCADLYENFLCQSCMAGTSRSQPDKCSKCPETTTNIVIIVGVVCGVFVLIGVLTRSALLSAKKRANQTGALLKIFLNYVQMTVLVADTHLLWPKALQQVFSSHQYAGNSGEQYLSLDCLLPHPFFDKTLGIALLPLVLIGVNLLFWGFIWIFSRLRGKAVRLQEKSVCSTIVSLFYFHLYITRTALSSFNCIAIPPEDTWLRVETTNKCWAKPHLTYTLAAALPAVLLWSAGIPALALLLLVRNRKQLAQGRARQMTGFLCVGYKQHFFFWEICIIYRKVCLATLQAFMSGFAPSTQGLTLVLLVFVTVHLQRTFAPFAYEVLNRAEYCSLLVVLVTAYAGLYFSLSSLSPATQIALLALVILTHCCYVVSIGKSIFRPLLRQLHVRLRNSAPSMPLHPLTKRCMHAYLDRLELQALKLTS